MEKDGSRLAIQFDIVALDKLTQALDAIPEESPIVFLGDDSQCGSYISRICAAEQTAFQFGGLKRGKSYRVAPKQGQPQGLPLQKPIWALTVFQRGETRLMDGGPCGDVPAQET